MAKISDVEIPSLLFAELGADPSTPATGKWRLYTKAGGIYLIDDAGAVIGPFSTGGSVSDTVYGAGWNGDTTVAPSKNAVYDKIETLGGSTNRGARVYRSAALSLANGGQTPIAFDAETFDTNTLHDTSTNPERVILNTVGKWLVTWQAAYSGNATGFRNADLYLNGSIHCSRSIPTWSGGTCMVGGSDIINAAAITDYVTLSPYQDSGGSLAFTVGSQYTFLAVTYLGT